MMMGQPRALSKTKRKGTQGQIKEDVRGTICGQNLALCQGKSEAEF